MSGKEETNATLGALHLLVKLQDGYDDDILRRIESYVKEDRARRATTLRVVYQSLHGLDARTTDRLNTILA